VRNQTAASKRKPGCFPTQRSYFDSSPQELEAPSTPRRQRTRRSSFFYLSIFSWISSYRKNVDRRSWRLLLLTKLGHNRAVSRTAVGDRWRVTLKRTVKRRIVVMLTLDDSKQLQAVIVLLSRSLSSKCTKTCAYGVIY
jgi:hypothetical protein